MEEITLSVMRNTQETEPVLRQVLDEFQQKHAIRVKLQMLPWETARQDVKNFAIHQHGPDVSAMGTTWVADLIAMNALQPLDQKTNQPVGKQEDFIAAAWETTRRVGEKFMYAAPWLMDTYVIHYRRDLFEQAGIDPNNAFESLAQIDETVKRVSQMRLPAPVQLPLHYDRFCLMHTLAAWVWGNGGEFCTSDGSKVLFDQPEALAGIYDYFNLSRHFSAEAHQRLAAPDCSNLFRQGESAMAFGTLSFMFSREQVPAYILENWRSAPIPGPHFAGGVNLVIWKYSLHENAALELIRYLNSPDVVTRCSQVMLTSPARLSVLESPAYLRDPILSVITRSARTGRSYYPVRLWGLIEDRFIEALLLISGRVLAGDYPDLNALIQDTIKPMARRLNLTLGS